MKGILRVVAGVRRVVCAPIDVFVSALLVARLLGSLVWILCTIPVAQRVAVWRFSRRLRRSGIDRDAAETLIDDYAYGMSLFGRERATGTSASG